MSYEPPTLTQTVTVQADDGQPIDDEHVQVISGLAAGHNLDFVKERLRLCTRPAYFVSERIS